MSQKDVETVQATWEEWGKGRIDFGSMDPSVEIFDHDLPDAGVYNGHEGFLQWLADWEAAWDNFSLIPKDFIDGGETVVVIAAMTATGRGSGITIEREDALVYRFRDGLIARVDYFNNRREALEAAGLSE
jgi:ketosteroid isomerase-like protein